MIFEINFPLNSFVKKGSDDKINSWYNLGPVRLTVSVHHPHLTLGIVSRLHFVAHWLIADVASLGSYFAQLVTFLLGSGPSLLKLVSSRMGLENSRNVQ